MKLRKVVLSVLFFTVIAICYVNQQAKIVIASYNIGKNKTKLDYLVDKNKDLQYNVNRLNSPIYLFSTINENVNKGEFKLTRNFEVKRLNITPHLEESSHNIVAVKSSISFFSVLLGLTAKAEAETLGDVKQK